MAKMDATLEAVAIQVLFFVLSIVGAWLVLKILKGTAQIKNKEAQFGGAAAMFIAIFFLLNKYIPEVRDGILTEARAAQTITTVPQGGSPQSVKVYVSPSQQRVTPLELKQLDNNKYVVNLDLGVAVTRPTEGGWSTGVVDAIQTISLADLPMMKMSLGATKAFAKNGIKSNPIFALKENAVHKVIFKSDSEIHGIRMDLNMFSDEDFVKKTLESQVEMTAQMMATSDLADTLKDSKKKAAYIEEIVNSVGPQLKEGFSNYIKASLPLEKQIQNGVYVTTFDITDLPDKSMGEMLFKGLSPLDRAIQSLAFEGLQIGGSRNLKIDQDQGVASFDATQRLRRVEVDGVETDVTLNNLGFLVAAGKRIVFVQLLILDTGKGLSSTMFLKTAMDSLLFSI